MKWFLEAQFSLKRNLEEPTQWEKLISALTTIDPRDICMWPKTAHYVFNKPVLPFKQQYPLMDRRFVQDLLRGFSHDPAAQVYMLHECIQQVTTRIEFDQLLKYAAPEIKEFYYCKKKLETPAFDAAAYQESKPMPEKVKSLMLGLQLGMTPTEMYYHAAYVMAIDHSEKTELNALPALDTNIFGL